MIDRLILAKDTLITFVNELFIRAVIFTRSGLGMDEEMRTIIIETGQEVQPDQYRGQRDIGKVIIHKGAKIGHRAFYKCTGITELTIAKGVTIGWNAF